MAQIDWHDFVVVETIEPCTYDDSAQIKPAVVFAVSGKGSLQKMILCSLPWAQPFVS